MGKPTLANVREQKVRPELVYVWFVYLDVHLFMFISTTLLDNSKKKINTFKLEYSKQIKAVQTWQKTSTRQKIKIGSEK